MIYFKPLTKKSYNSLITNRCKLFICQCIGAAIVVFNSNINFFVAKRRLKSCLLHQKQLCSITMMAAVSAHSSSSCRCSNLSLYTFYYIYHSNESASDCITNVANLLLLLKGLHMCIYIDSIERKKIYPMTSVALEQISEVFTLLVYLAITSFFFLLCLFVLFLFHFLQMENCLWGLFCMNAAICCTWANNCVYKLWSLSIKV